MSKELTYTFRICRFENALGETKYRAQERKWLGTWHWMYEIEDRGYMDHRTFKIYCEWKLLGDAADYIRTLCNKRAEEYKKEQLEKKKRFKLVQKRQPFTIIHETK